VRRQTLSGYAHVQHQVAGLQLIKGAQGGPPFGIVASRAQREPGAIRMFGHRPDRVFAVLMRHVAGMALVPSAMQAATPAGPIDLREAALALHERAGTVSAAAGFGDPDPAIWVVLSASAPSSILLGTAGRDAPDVTVQCAIEKGESSGARLALFPEAAGGNLFSRGSRQRRAEELCRDLMSKTALAVAQQAGSTQPREMQREFTRGSALLLVGGATLKGELHDISVAGVSATIPRHALEASAMGYALRGEVGMPGTLMMRLRGIHVALPMRIVHLRPLARGVQIGMQLT
jgi:hypothetical protein